MKVLFVLGFTNPSDQAAWTRIEFFANAWSKKGHSVDVLGTFSYRVFQKRGARKIGSTSIFNLVFNVNLMHPLVFTLNSAISLVVSMLFLRARGPNVVVVSVPAGDVGFGTMLACKLMSTKCVVDYRDEWEDYTKNLASNIGKSFYSAIKKIAGYLYGRCEAIVTVTPNMMTKLGRRGLNNVKIMPNGADIRTFDPSMPKKRNGNFRIFYSGMIGSYYRLDIAVKATRKLVSRGMDNLKLVIAGGGEIEKVLNLAAKLGVSSDIEYKGAISDKSKLAGLIGEADVGLIPYDDNPLWKNSLPAKFFEYCACGIPVIATAYEDSLLAELIRCYGVGLTSPPMDEEKLAETICQIYKNEPLREAAGRRARKLVEEKFDRTKTADEFLKLIETNIGTSIKGPRARATKNKHRRDGL